MLHESWHVTVLMHVLLVPSYCVPALQASVLATHTGVLPEVNSPVGPVSTSRFAMHWGVAPGVNSPVDPLICVKSMVHVPDVGVVAEGCHAKPYVLHES